MTTENIIKIIELCMTFVGLVFIIFGWIIPNQQSKKAEVLRRENEIKAEKQRWHKEHIDKQISVFYGPISSILRQRNTLFNLLLYQLGRQCVFKAGQGIDDLPPNEQLIWKHYVNTCVLPSLKEISLIIKENIHLVHKSEIPTCFNTFHNYALGWELLHSQTEQNVPNYYEYHYSSNFPAEFTRYIDTTLALLLNEQARLIAEDSGKLSSTAY